MQQEKEQPFNVYGVEVDPVVSLDRRFLTSPPFRFLFLVFALSALFSFMDRENQKGAYKTTIDETTTRIQGDTIEEKVDPAIKTVHLTLE